MHEPRWGGEAAPITALDRAPQILPVPLGGLTPARHRTSRLALLWRRYQSTALTAMALAAIALGVWLALSPGSFAVDATARGVRIDDFVLNPLPLQPEQGVRVFTGKASLAISDAGPGETAAGAVMTWGGLPATGRCVLRVFASTASDACEFTIGDAAVTSLDTFDFRARTWRRRYGDGGEVAITVAAGSALIPIPFPLGR
jgi:hypothetical protein